MSTPMIAMTTRSSTSVNACFCVCNRAFFARDRVGGTCIFMYTFPQWCHSFSVRFEADKYGLWLEDSNLNQRLRRHTNNLNVQVVPTIPPSQHCVLLFNAGRFSDLWEQPVTPSQRPKAVTYITRGASNGLLLLICLQRRLNDSKAPKYSGGAVPDSHRGSLLPNQARRCVNGHQS